MSVRRVALTGGSGFLGSYVAPLLAERCERMVALVRATSRSAELAALGAELRIGDLDDEASLEQAFEGCDTLVNLASLGFGHAPALIGAARRAGVRRAVFISTTAIFTSLPAGSRNARLAAERWVRSSGLAYTLLRPTMIYGSQRDRNIARLIRLLARCPVILVPGSGQALQQPVHVEDVARAVVAALERDRAVGQAFTLAGPRPLPFNELVDLTAAALGRRVRRVHLPLLPLIVAARLWTGLGLPAPVRPEQLERLAEDKAFDIGAAARELDFRPREFERGVREQVARMGLAAAAPAPRPGRSAEAAE